jgi:protein tyrosine phosphatase
MSGNTIWQQWHQVTVHIGNVPGRHLFRSSAPNYSGTDSSQDLTQAAVDFLVQKGINRIISLNHNKYKPAELDRLRQANIEYCPIPVVDFSAPTLAQLKEAIAFFMEKPVTTLVHCGYGHGRTGTCVTALQIGATKGNAPPEADWEPVNHVETDAQKIVLRQLRATYTRRHGNEE